jgi:hypothetical protein
MGGSEKRKNRIATRRGVFSSSSRIPDSQDIPFFCGTSIVEDPGITPTGMVYIGSWGRDPATAAAKSAGEGCWFPIIWEVGIVESIVNWELPDAILCSAIGVCAGIDGGIGREVGAEGAFMSDRIFCTRSLSPPEVESRS